MNVSARYAALEIKTNAPGTVVHVRLLDKENGERLAAEVEMRAANGELLSRDRTRAGMADMNDMPDFTLPDGAANVTFRFVRGGETREKVLSCQVCLATHTLDFVWSELTPVPPAISDRRVVAGQTGYGTRHATGNHSFRARMRPV